LANGAVPVSASAWAAECSWCGKIRSRPSALDVEAHAEAVERDHRAFDVPAGPSLAQRGVPERLAEAVTAPQQRIEGVAFAGEVRIAAALGEQGQHRVPVEVGLVAEAPRTGHVEVDVVVDVVRRVVGEQPGDRVGQLGHGLDGADVVVGRQHPQRGHVLAEQFDLPLGQAHPVLADVRGPLQQWVVDVGDVLDVVHLVSRVAPHPLHQVEGEIGGRMAQVRRVVRGDAADV